MLAVPTSFLTHILRHYTTFFFLAFSGILAFVIPDYIVTYIGFGFFSPHICCRACNYYGMKRSDGSRNGNTVQRFGGNHVCSHAVNLLKGYNVPGNFFFEQRIHNCVHIRHPLCTCLKFFIFTLRSSPEQFRNLSRLHEDSSKTNPTHLMLNVREQPYNR